MPSAGASRPTRSARPGRPAGSPSRCGRRGWPWAGSCAGSSCPTSPTRVEEDDMTLWWIGNGVLLLVVVPVLVALLNRVLAALERIRAASDDILAGGVALTGELDDVPEALAVTDTTIEAVKVGAVRYAGSVAKLLG